VRGAESNLRPYRDRRPIEANRYSEADMRKSICRTIIAGLTAFTTSVAVIFLDDLGFGLSV